MPLQERDGATEEHAEHLCTSGGFAARNGFLTRRVSVELDVTAGVRQRRPRMVVMRNSGWSDL